MYRMIDGDDGSDANYHYEFWRPVTAIRNGDLHENAAVKADATWQHNR